MTGVRIYSFDYIAHKDTVDMVIRNGNQQHRERKTLSWSLFYIREARDLLKGVSHLFPAYKNLPLCTEH